MKRWVASLWSSGPAPGSARGRAAAALFLGLYALLTAVLLWHHEPWRDEADAWLMARDASVLEVLRIAGHSGTPGLWYFLQMPLAKAGFPYRAQGVLNLLLMLGAAALFLFRAPLPLAVKVLALFGIHLSFEYPVVARNYGLGILIAFALAAWDGRRASRPLVYGILLALLANVSAHFALVALALALSWAWEERPRRGRMPSGAVVVAFAVAALGVLAALFQLRPREGGQFSPELSMIFEPRRALGVARGLIPQVLPVWLTPLGIVGWGLAVLHLTAAPRALASMLLSSAGLTYIFVFKYSGGDRHYGLLLVVLLVGLWLGESDRGGESGWPSIALPERARGALRAATYGVLAVCFAIGVLYSALRLWPTEIAKPYSGAAEMAHYLREQGLDDRPIAGHPANACEAVLPYLRVRRFYYPGIDDFGSHMLWDRQYMQGTFVPLGEALARVARRFPDWERGRLLLLSTEPVPAAAERGLRLRHRTREVPFRVPEESYFLYERAR